jgi:phage terminase large subunit-like protein
MTDYMVDDLVAIYDNPQGTRRAIISRARKNAKSVETALILLLHLTGPEALANSQLYSTALSRDQASLVYAYACKMAMMHPALRRNVRPVASGKELHCDRLGTKYKALSADAATAVGLSPVLLIHDELGQVRGPTSALYEACETATGANVDPLSIIISTQAAKDGDLLSMLIDDAIKGRDPRTVLRFDTADEGLDPFSRKAIEQANPGLYTIMNAKEVFAMAADAKALPSRESAYRNFVLNQRVEVSSPLFGRKLWERNGNSPRPFEPTTEVYLGLDLSAVADLTAAVAVGLMDGVWQVHPTFWTPADGIEEKSRQDRVPYDIWRDQGYLNAIPGPTIDYAFVAAWLVDYVARFNVVRIAFDAWNFKLLRPRLIEAGMSEAAIERLFFSFGQGFKSMSPAVRSLENDVMKGALAHGKHPVLSMCIANTKVTKDAAGNRKLDKQKSTGRIDGAVALVMARGMVEEPEGEAPKPEPKHQMFFL